MSRRVCSLPPERRGVDIFPGISHSDLGVFALGLVLTGVLSGLAAGLLGVGGGIVIVPILYHVLTLLGVDESVRMQVAVGTSLATIVPTSISSIRAHDEKGAVDWELLKRWAAPMLVGVLIGAALTGIIASRVLAIIFAVVALPIALFLGLGSEQRRLADRVPPGPIGAGLAAMIGGISAMMGIGGGVVGVPVMTLCGVPMHRAVGTASAFGMIIAVPGTIASVLSGWHAHLLPPYSIGYANLVGFCLMAPASFAAAPVGATLAHMTDVKRLRLVFAAFVIITTGRMLWDAVAWRSDFLIVFAYFGVAGKARVDVGEHGTHVGFRSRALDNNDQRRFVG